MSARDCFFKERAKTKAIEQDTVELKQQLVDLRAKLKSLQQDIGNAIVTPAERKQAKVSENQRKKVGDTLNRSKDIYLPETEEKMKHISNLKEQVAKQREDASKQQTLIETQDGTTKTTGIQDVLDGISQKNPICQTINDYFEEALTKNSRAATIGNVLFSKGKRANVEEGLALLEIAHEQGFQEATVMLLLLYSNMYPSLRIQPQPEIALELLNCIKKNEKAFKKSIMAYKSPLYNDIYCKTMFCRAMQLIDIQQAKRGTAILEDLATNHGFLEAYFVLAINHLEGTKKIPNVDKAEAYLEKVVSYLSFSEDVLDQLKVEARDEWVKEQQFLEDNPKYPERLAYQSDSQKNKVLFYQAVFEHCEAPYLDYLRRNALEYDRFMGDPVLLHTKETIKEKYNLYKRPYILGPIYNWRMEKSFLIDIYCGSLMTLAELCLSKNKVERADTLLSLLPFGFKPNTLRYDFEIAMLYITSFPKELKFQKKAIAMLENIVEHTTESVLLERSHHALGLYYSSANVNDQAIDHLNSAAQMGYYPSMLYLANAYTHSSSLLLRNHTMASFWYRSMMAIEHQQHRGFDAMVLHAKNWSNFADAYVIPELNKVSSCPSNMRINIWRSKTIEFFLWLATQSKVNFSEKYRHRHALLLYKDNFAFSMRSLSLLSTCVLMAIPLTSSHYAKLYSQLSMVTSTIFHRVKNYFNNK
mmetsp:Transcript_192/g.330  ORF Transcript_192/g.330 Transcript_192/m.330 type:complete len:700 (-) Transcript_192:1381-3480(-)